MTTATLQDPDVFVRYLTDINPGRWDDALYIESPALHDGRTLPDDVFDRVHAQARLNDLPSDIDWLGYLEGITTDVQWAKLTDLARPLWVEVTTQEQAVACGLLSRCDQCLNIVDEEELHTGYCSAACWLAARAEAATERGGE
jgi:hypothetical protein